MKVQISKEECAKLLTSPVPGYVVTAADWTIRKDGDVELTLEPSTDPVLTITELREPGQVRALDPTTEARR